MCRAVSRVPCENMCRAVSRVQGEVMCRAVSCVPGEVVRVPVPGVRGAVRGGDRDHYCAAHEPPADAARVRVYPSRRLLHLHDLHGHLRAGAGRYLVLN